MGFQRSRVGSSLRHSNAMDKNHTGLLSPFELARLMRSLDHSPNDDELGQIMQDHDVYAKGGINLQDFLSVMAKREQDVALKEKLMQAFAVFDRDGNGFVAMDELRTQLCTVGANPYQEKEFEDFMQEYQ